MATILTKKSDTSSAVPASGDLTNSTGGAELAVNTADKRIFTKNSGGTVVELGTNPSSVTLPNGTANGVTYLNGSKVLTSGSALTFDGTNLGVSSSSLYPLISVVSSGTNSIFGFRMNNTGTGGVDWRVEQGRSSVGDFNITAPSLYASPLYSVAANGSYHNWHLAALGERMRLTSTGLGIGTSSPGYKLDVYGVIRSYDSGSSTSGYLFSGTNIVNLEANSTNPLAFRTNSTERMRIDSSGNVGIGVTSITTPASSRRGLQISNSTNGGGIYLGPNSTDSDNARIVSASSGADLLLGGGGAAGIVAAYTNGTERMRINSSGNVGINTSSPDVALEIQPSIAYTTAYAADLGVNAANLGYGSSLAVWDSSNSATVSGLSLFTRSTGLSRWDILNVWTSTYTGDLVFRGRSGGTSTIEAMRITSSGNVGIGTTTTDPYSLGSTGKTLALNSASASVGSILTLASGGTNRGYLFANSSNVVLSAVDTGSGGRLVFNTANTERMRIDSSGNVGIGTSSPAQKLSLYTGSATSTYLRIQNTVNDSYFGVSGTGNVLVESTGAYPLLLLTSGTERMRIASNGDLYIARTSTFSYANGKVCIEADGIGNPGLVVGVGVTTSYNNIVLGNGNGNVGSIVTNGSSTAFNTSSDYRLKENIAPMTGALATVAQLNPVTYTWKVDGSAGQGFIAHELQAVLPDCVTGEKDAVDAEGKPVYQGVDTSFLVATLTAAIQEQQAIIESLKSRLDAAGL